MTAAKTKAPQFGAFVFVAFIMHDSYQYLERLNFRVYYFKISWVQSIASYNT